MEFEQTPIQGLILIKPKVFGDKRGLFVETWQKERYEEIGIKLPFVQDNHSRSVYGVLRGVHYQKEHAQGKLVSVSLGSVFDVAVDIRPGSPTFGKWYGGCGLNLGLPMVLWCGVKLLISIINARIIITRSMKHPFILLTLTWR